MSVYYKTKKIADIGYVLNLPSRDDRKKQISKVLNENCFNGWNFFYGQTIDDPNLKKLGCTISELKIFEEFLNLGGNKCPICLIKEVKRLREGIGEVLDGTLPYLAEKRIKELLEVVK